MTRAVATALAAALAVAACGGGGTANKDRPSEWEEKNERFLKSEQTDRVPEPPAYPNERDLIAFYVTAASSNKHFVDRRSVNVRDGLVHYTLVVRSPEGAENVFFEALNCKDRQYRNYARGTSDRKWIVRPTEWRNISSRQYLPQNTLHWEYFCPNRVAVADAAEGVSALEQGGHPWSKKPESNTPSN